LKTLLDRILDVPLSREAYADDLAERERERDADHNIAAFASRIEQLTNKSAALLQADSIFIAVALFIMQLRHPPILTAKTALVILVISAILLASNLWARWPRPLAEGNQAQFRHMYDIRRWRAARFNAALYLFFIGVAVLLFALLRVQP
jgi:hypothetical protein